MAFAADGRTLASGSTDGRAKVWEVGRHQHPVAVSPPLGNVFTVAFSPDGRTVATGGEFIHLWSYASGELLTVIPGHRNQVRAIAFSPDGRSMASAGDDLMIRVWNLATAKTEYVYRSHTRPIHDLAFSPNGRRLASASKDGTIRLRDANSPQDRQSQPSDDVLRVRFSPSHDLLATVANHPDACILQVWNPADVNAYRTYRHPALSSGDAPSISTVGQRVAIASHPGPIVIWNVATGETRTLRHPIGHEPFCVFSPDGNWLAVGDSESDRVRILDVQTGDEVAALSGRRTAAFSPDGRVVACESARQPFAVELWDLKVRKTVAVLSGHTGLVRSAVFSADGRFLATGSSDGTAKVWDVPSAKAHRTLRAHPDELSEIDFTPDGRRLATAGSDGTVKLWEVETGQMLLSLPVSRGSVGSVSFSRNGLMLATASVPMMGDGRVDLWHAPPVTGSLGADRESDRKDPNLISGKAE